MTDQLGPRNSTTPEPAAESLGDIAERAATDSDEQMLYLNDTYVFYGMVTEEAVQHATSHLMVGHQHGPARS